MVSSRPRRSSTKITYKLTPASDPEDSTSNLPEANGETSKDTPNKKEKRRRKEETDVETDGSVFGEDQAVQSSEETASNNSAVEEVSEPSVHEDEEVKGSVANSDDNAPVQATVRNKLANYTPVLKAQKMTINQSTLRQIQKSTIPQTTTVTSTDNTRPIAVPLAETLVSEYQRPVLPAYEPPRRTFQFDNQNLTSFATFEITVSAPIDAEERKNLNALIAANPFGPTAEIVQDMGWRKGKWQCIKDDNDGETYAVNPRWGGWYPELGPTVWSRVQSGKSYYPKMSFLSKPRPLYTEPNEEEPEESRDIVMEEHESSKNAIGNFNNLIIHVGLPNKEERLVLQPFEGRRLNDFLPSKPGAFCFAGAPVSSLAWAPRIETTPAPNKEYLLIATQSHPDDIAGPPNLCKTMLQIWSLDTSEDSAFSINSEIRSDDSMDGRVKGGLNLEMGVCIDIGEARQVKWCPRGGEGSVDQAWEDSLGIIAGVFTGGQVALFRIPSPDAIREQQALPDNTVVYITLEPTVELRLPNVGASALDWGNHDFLGVGFSNGTVAAFKISDALLSGKKSLKPTYYNSSLHNTQVCGVAFIRAPPSIVRPGKLTKDYVTVFDLDGEPCWIVSTGYDGAVSLWELSELGGGRTVGFDRDAGLAIAFDPFSGRVISNVSEGHVRAEGIVPFEYGQTRSLLDMNGKVFDIACSDYHPFTAFASADGTATIISTYRTVSKRRHLFYLSQKVFRMDFNRLTGEYKMIDNFLPDTRNDAKPKKASESKTNEKWTMAWSPEIAVLSVDWHPTLRRAPLLVSGTRSGLVRVDWLERESN